MKITELFVEIISQEDVMTKEKELDSCVVFEFCASFKKGEEYKLWVYDLVRDFLIFVDPDINNEFTNVIAKNGLNWNEEGQIYDVKIDGDRLTCKMYYFDEGSIHFKQGIMFRDHYCAYAMKTVHAISDKFEEFLKMRSIKYDRENREKNR